MLRIKRLYTFMLQTFLPLFAMTFGICLFIVLLQFIWRYIDDMVGKGLEMSVLAEMFLYAALFLIPMALPLAILLASLMTFGNLGERLELLAMKSAGVSLIHIMRPLIILVCSVSIGAFFFQNNAMPVINVKLYSLLSAMKHKSPELEIPEGVFSNDIPGYNVYVKKKDPATGLLKNIKIYDYSNGPRNARVIVADSGRLKSSEDRLFLVLTMYSGESFESMQNQTGGTTNQKTTAVPYRRETFNTKEILIAYDDNFSRADESLFQNQYVGKDLIALQTSIDSMSYRLDSIKSINAESIYDNSYRRSFNERDTATNARIIPLLPERSTAKKKGEEIQPLLSFEELYNSQSASSKASILSRAKSAAENVKQDYLFKSSTIGNESYILRRHLTEWHKKFTVSFACLVFFFIGAPLGAIIRKGGLGVPVIISVLLFIVYYIIDNMGFKMARDGVWPAWQGMWLSSAILAPMGIFLTYKAVNDSVILNADTYINALKNLLGKRTNRNIGMKEVIIFSPDYTSASVRLESLIADCQNYLDKHKRWVNYFDFWKAGGRDSAAEQLSVEVESLVEELANSDNILVLNKLMDYPIMTAYSQMNLRIDKKTGMAIALVFPVGLPLYLLSIFRRKLLRHDVKVIERTSNELSGIIVEQFPSN